MQTNLQLHITICSSQR